MNIENILVKERTETQICNLAREIRRKYGKGQEYFNILRFIEVDLPEIIDNFSFVILDEEDMRMKGVEALTEVTDKEVVMYVPDDLYTKAKYGVGRARYTLAHEVAHVLMHSEEAAVLARLGAKVEPTRRYAENRRKDPEWQANEFAAELLLPRKLAIGIGKRDLVERFGVSESVAVIQKRKVR